MSEGTFDPPQQTQILAQKRSSNNIAEKNKYLHICYNIQIYNDEWSISMLLSCFYFLHNTYHYLKLSKVCLLV